MGEAGLELLILGIDTATLACSVALLKGESLLAEYTLNIRKTHSERLMPLIDALLKESAVEREALQAVAVAAGPGSFTGVRIGVSTARALAQGLAVPAVGLSTLQALAEAVALPGALICPLLDARRSEIYSALYRRESHPHRSLELIIPPAAVELAPFVERLKTYGEAIVFTGEGLNTYGSYLGEALGPLAVIMPEPLRNCSAARVALCGSRLLARSAAPSYHELLPIYLRRPEAERRLEERKRRGAS